jgi:NitT/TauT family transport system permease protein
MRERVLTAVSVLVTLVIIVAAWKAYVSWRDVSKFLLPPPEDVWRALVDLVGEGSTWHHAWVTLVEVAAGFAIATAAGVVVGVMVAEVRTLERALTPYLVALQVMPKVAVIPVLLLWFGFGAGSKVAVAAVFGFFPITAGTIAGLKATEGGHRDLTRVFGASRRQRLLVVDLPGALPTVLTGMEVGIVLATVGAVVAEYLAGSEGLGWLALRSLNQVRIPALFAVIVLLSVLGVVLYAFVAGLRRVLVPWHPSSGPLRQG